MADIPVNVNDALIVVVATSNKQADYDFDFLAYEAAHLKTIKINTSNGSSETLLAGIDFGVSGLQQAGGGSITLNDPNGILVGDKIIIYRDVPIERIADYQQSGDFRAETVNLEQDLQTMMMQELRRDIGRSVSFPLGTSGATINTIPEGHFWKTDGDGNLVDGGDISNFGQAEELATRAEVAATRAEAVANEYNSIMDFYDYEYIDSRQIALIRANDTDSQNETLVTTGVQDMMDAVADWLDGGDNRLANVKIRGRVALNDEIFSEYFAQKIYDSVRVNCRFFLDDVVRFCAKNWGTRSAVRTSGMWAGVTHKVPSAMFRWEPDTKSGWSFSIGNDVSFHGELNHLTDPIGFKALNVNTCRTGGMTVIGFYHVGWMMEDLNNSDFFGPAIVRCGYQPTQSGGNGFIPASTLFSTVAGTGTTTVTASASAFTADHVGKWFMIQGAGESGSVFSGVITSQSGTTAVLDQECTANVTNKHGSFPMLRGNTVANSTTVNLNTAVTDDLTGQYVFIAKAGSLVKTNQDCLVTIVTNHDFGATGKIITLADAAANTVAETSICLGPSWFIGETEDADLYGHNNDAQFFGVRCEHAFNAETGSALPAIFQNILACQFVSCKVHSTGEYYQNFAAGEMSLWADACKYLQTWGFMFDHGEWSPDRGEIWVMGAENNISLTEIRNGNSISLDRNSQFFIDPMYPIPGWTKVAFSGYINQPYTPLSTQSIARYGTNGSKKMLKRNGHVTTRFGREYPDMPAAQFDGTNWVDFTPILRFGGSPIEDNSGTYAIQTGKYTVDGDLVYVQIEIQLSAKGTGSGAVDILLPDDIRPANYNEYLSAGLMTGFTSLTSPVFAATVGGSSDKLQLRMSGATGHINLTNANITNTTRVVLSGRFEILG